MRNCITDKSIKLLGSYFKSKLPSIINKNISYADVIKNLYIDTVVEFNNLTESVGSEGITNEEIVLQHLTIAPQIIQSYLSSQPNLKNYGLQNAATANARIIYDASQSTKLNFFQNIITEFRDNVQPDVSAIIIKAETVDDSFSARRFVFNASHPNEIIYNAKTNTYSDKATDPKRVLANNTARSIMSKNNVNNFKFKLFLDGVAYLKIVDANGADVYFNESGEVTTAALGKLAIFDVVNKKAALRASIDARIRYEISVNKLSPNAASKKVNTEVDNYIKAINAAIQKTLNNEDVLFEIDLSYSSYGFVEKNHSKRTVLNKLSNSAALGLQIIQSASRQLPAIKIPSYNEPIEVYPIPVESLPKSDIDFLYQLISNKNLKNERGEPLTQDERNILITKYIDFNSNGKGSPIFMVSYEKGTTGKLKSITLGLAAPIAVDNMTRDIFDKFLGTAFSFPVSSYIPKGNIEIKNVEDVTYNQQYIETDGGVFIAKKPSTATALYMKILDVSQSTVKVVADIVDDVVITKEVSLTSRMLESLETTVLTNAENEVRGYSPYLAFYNSDYRVVEKPTSSYNEFFLSIEQANKSNGKNVPKATTVEETLADQWFEESGWSSILKVNAYSDVHERGKSFIASLVGNTIGLWKGSDRTAIYHEVFHGHVRGILSNQERKELYTEILSENKGRVVEVVVKGVKKSISFNDLNMNNEVDQLSLEEWLAEEFRAYGRNRSKYNNKPKSKVAQFFEKLLAALRSLFGNHTYSEVVLMNSLSPKINAIFNNIYEGNVDFSKFENTKPNIEYFSSYEIEDKLTYNEMTYALDSMSSLLYNFIDKVVNPASNIDVNTKLSELIIKLSRLANNDPKKASLIQEYNSIVDNETPNSLGLYLLENNPQLLSSAFEYILSKLQSQLELYNASDSPLFKRIAESMQKVIDNFGDVSQPKESFINDTTTLLGVFLNNYSTLQLDDRVFKDTVENQTSENLTLLFDTTGAEQALSELIDARTKELLVTLPKFTDKGAPQINAYGAISLSNLNAVIFAVANAVEGNTTMKQMYDSLVSVSTGRKKNNTILQLVKRLGDPNKEGITKAEIKQWMLFWSSFVKPSRRLRTFEFERTVKELTEEMEGLGIKPSEVESIISKLTSIQPKQSTIKREWSLDYIYNLDVPPLELANAFIDENSFVFDSIIESFEPTVYVDNNSGVIYETRKPNTSAMARYKAEPAALLQIFGIGLKNTPSVNAQIREGSEFIGSEFIDAFWTSLQNRLTASGEAKSPKTLQLLFKFFKYSENGENKTSQDLSGYLTNLAELASVTNEDYSTFMQKTPEGENQSTKPKHSSLSVEVDILNSMDSYSELINTPGMEHFDIERNPEVAANNTFVKMFYLDESEDSENYKKRNPEIKIKIENLVGSIVKDGSTEKGVKSISTDEFSKFTTDFYATLENYQEIMRSEGKSTSPIVIMPTLKGGKLAKNPFSNEEVARILREDYSEIFGSEGLVIYELFKSHIESEIVRINRIEALVKKLESGEIESVDFDQKFLTRGVSFIKFESILSEETKEKLKNLVNKNGELILKPFQLDDILTDSEKKAIKKEIEKQLVDHFKYTTENLINEFGEKLLISDNLLNNSKLEKDQSDEDTKKRLFFMVNLNNFYNNLEYQSLFLGDPSSYEIIGEDYHKRIAGKISAGDIFANEESWYNFVNSEKYNKDAFAKKHFNSLTIEQKQSKNLPDIFKSIQYSGYLRTGIIAEAVSSSEYIEHYKEIFGFDLKKYNEQEEADGSAFIKFDTYRYLLDSINEWSDGQENLYQALLKGENIDQRKVKNTFPIKKFQQYGPLLNESLKAIGLTPYAFHKYSVVPIIPSTALEGTPLEDLHNRMMEEGIDYIAMNSASKLASLGKVTLESYENNEVSRDNIYDVDNGRVITDNAITPNVIHVKHLKSQVFLSEGFKGYTGLPSQMRKISILGLYNNGKPSDYAGDRTAWEKLTDAEKRNKSKHYSWIKRYNEVLNEIRTFSRNNLLENIGLKEKVNKDGSKEYIGSTVELAKYIKQELTNKNLLPEEIASVLNPDGSGELISDLSFSLNSAKIEEVLMTLVDNELRNLKFNGEGLVQQSGTMVESKFKPELASKEDVLKYGTNGLSFYHVLDENGKPAKNKKGFFRVAEAQVKIALQGDFMNLLYLDYKGQQIAQYTITTDAATGKIKKEFDFNASLERLNLAIKDNLFFEKHKDMLRLVGPRIPTQAENSIESMVVREFLPPIEGNKIILPAEIVAKAGSDYDIDKLFMLFPNLAYYPKEGVEIVKYDKGITESDKSLYDALENIKIDSKETRLSLEQAYANKKTIFENFQDIEEFVSEELSDLFEQIDLINEEIENQIDEANKVYNAEGKYKKFTRTEQKDYHIKSTEKINELSEQRNNINQEINERIDEVALEALGESDRNKLFQEQNNFITKFNNKLDSLNKKRNATLRKINSKSIKGLQNDLLYLFSERIAMADQAEQLLFPNSTDLFDEIAALMEDKLNDTAFFNKYNRGRTDKSPKKDNGISGTTIYEMRYNLQKHQENSVGLQSLGIAAVTSTFYAVFTQMGAKLDGVTQVEQKEFNEALKRFQELSLKETITPMEQAQLKQAKTIINKYKDYSLKIESQTLGGFVSLSNLKNVNNITISNIIGQLINGYVDVAKKAWIYNVQGNLQNTPQLLFMVMAGAKVEDAVFLSSNPLVIEYNKLKAEYSGVFANMSRDVNKSVVLSRNQVVKKVQEELFNKYNELGLINISDSFELINKKIKESFTSEELKNAALSKRDLTDKQKGITKRDIEILAHYMSIENMSNDITEFTMVNKFDTEKMQNISNTQERVDKTIEIKSKSKSYSNDWFTDILDTPIGQFANDEFILDLLSKYFGIRNNPAVVKQSIKSKRPFGVDKAFHYDNFKNDFTWFLWQNSLFRDNSYMDFSIVENKDIDQAILIDKNIVNVNYALIEKAIADEELYVGNIFPTQGHYIRYEIERRKIDAFTESLTDKEFYDRYFHFQNIGSKFTRGGTMRKIAAFKSTNNVAMFTYTLGYATIFKQLQLKYREELLDNQLFQDLKYDSVESNANLFLEGLSSDESSQVRSYKENLIELANSPIPAISEFFQMFTTYSIMQSGLSKGKYNMTRIIDESVFFASIDSAYDIQNITALLDKYSGELKKGKKLEDLDIPYLSVFAELFNKVSQNETKYRTRGKGVNYITDAVENVADGVMDNALSYQNVGVFNSFKNLPADFLKLSVEDIFDEQGNINIEYLESIQDEKIAVLAKTKFIAPENGSQEKLDTALYNYLNIDNSGAFAKALIVSKGQRSNNISISDAEILKKYSLKDEMMANSSTVSIGKATEGSNPKYESSSKSYADNINKKYPEKLAGNKIKFKSSDKVWVFGSGIFENAYKGEMNKSQWEAAVKKTFDEYHKKYIEEALKAGVSTFFIGDATGIDQLALEYLKGKGFNTMVRYTNTGKYYEVVNESYKEKATDVHKISVAPVSISLAANVSFYSTKLNEEINKLSADELQSGVGYEMVKANVLGIIKLKVERYSDFRNEFKKVLNNSVGSPIVEGFGLQNAFIEQYLSELRVIVSNKSQSEKQQLKNRAQSSTSVKQVVTETAETNPELVNIEVKSADYGVVQAETNPSKNKTKEFVELIKPQIQTQTYKENKGKNANEMFHYGLMWARTNKTAKPVKINAFDKGVYYAYHELDQKGNQLPNLSQLQPIINEIQNSLGLDMSDYDSVIGNIYLDDQYVYPHKDTTESVTARNYPVIVYTIGNDTGLGIVDNNEGKMTFANQYDKQWLPNQDKLKGYTNELKTKNGSIYTFGLDGKGRFELTHSTPMNNKKMQDYPPITLPNGKVVTKYTITLTFRRAADLTAEMPITPAKITTTQSSTSVESIPSLIIEQNFADGSPYEFQGQWQKRTMQPKFIYKSSMELVLSGDRTRSTRSKTEIAGYMKAANVSKVSDLIGKEVLMFDKTGNVPGKAVVIITNIANFTQEYQDATWQKEGWTKDVTDRLVGEYPYAIEFVLVRNVTFTSADIKNAQRKDC